MEVNSFAYESIKSMDVIIFEKRYIEERCANNYVLQIRSVLLYYDNISSNQNSNN